MTRPNFSLKTLATFCAALAALVLAAPQTATAEPLRIVITDGVIEPLPFAIPQFIAENGGAGEYAANISRVVAADLAGTGLFAEIPANAYISQVTNFDAPVAYEDWKAIFFSAMSG